MHGSRVIPIGQDSYFTQGTRVETLYRNPALEQTRAEKLCRTPKDSDRASALDLRGGLSIGREDLRPSKPRHSPYKASLATTLRMRALQVEFSSNGVCLLIFTKGRYL
jgi:hypothetical protein